MTRLPPGVPTSQLVPLLRCPLCGKGFYGLYLNVSAFRADLGCQRKDCPQKWWAMQLHAGAVLPQIAAVVGVELAPRLMQDYALPDSIAQPLFWQLSLTGNQAYHRNEARKAGLETDPVPNLRRPA